jgi:D-cysteine desulfhydrase family pyridoxal phosphate-dependent enzyme
MAQADMRELQRVALIEGPTPVQRADRLAVALGLPAGALYVKRDDLTALAGGGNKVRKLEYLCAAAQREGADTLVTGGGPQSNHVRLTAAAARRVGLRCAVVLSGPPPQALSGNLLVDALLGPDVTWTMTGGLAAVEAQLAGTAERLRAQGARPYLIPIGGADAVGSQGYRLAATEIAQQVPGHGLLVVPDGSGGTHAGLAAGLGAHERIHGVSVGVFPDITARIQRLAAETARLAGLSEPSGDAQVDERFAAAGYGTELEAVHDALRLAAQTEGLILDPVYTGKALAGLIAGLADGTVTTADGPIVFVHCGGVFGLLSERYADWLTGVYGGI